MVKATNYCGECKLPEEYQAAPLDPIYLRCHYKVFDNGETYVYTPSIVKPEDKACDGFKPKEAK